ncbi:MAG: dihydropteroate synthase [Actinomycetota bacterium]|nr:dihydropteroate synthase [Actinomycetota bacterium]
MTIVMGIVNVTPDSFSDGGRWFDHHGAIAHGRELIAEGADIVDVGGESTRPGAQAVPESEELRRVLPVVEALAGEATVSIDTRKPVVAAAAIAAGATIVNDVSSSLFEVAAAGGAGWVAMHARAEPATMHAHAHYDDVVAEVRDHLVACAEKARAAGVEQLWIDPGIGFAKTAAHNLSLLRHLDVLVATGWDVAVGTSRKSFLGPLSVGPGEAPAPPDERVEASVATAVWAITQGAAMVRVHDVVAVTSAVRLARRRSPHGIAVGAPGARR